MIKVIIPMCVMVPLVLLLCYAPVKKYVFIPHSIPNQTPNARTMTLSIFQLLELAGGGKVPSSRLQHPISTHCTVTARETLR